MAAKYAGYEELEAVLVDALVQAAAGKGKERHAKSGTPWMEQKILSGQRSYGMGFALGQASKKLEEAFKMKDWEAARRDLLGAIVYTAAAINYGDELNRVPSDEELLQTEIVDLTDVP